MWMHGQTHAHTTLRHLGLLLEPKISNNTAIFDVKSFFLSFGGNFQASRISGRRKPSQSPSMRLLGMLHVQDDDSDGKIEKP